MRCVDRFRNAPGIILHNTAPPSAPLTLNLKTIGCGLILEGQRAFLDLRQTFHAGISLPPLTRETELLSTMLLMLPFLPLFLHYLRPIVHHEHL